MENRTPSQSGKLKALCSVKQRGDEGKEEEKTTEVKCILDGAVVLHGVLIVLK